MRESGVETTERGTLKVWANYKVAVGIHKMVHITRELGCSKELAEGEQIPDAMEELWGYLNTSVDFHIAEDERKLREGETEGRRGHNYLRD